MVHVPLVMTSIPKISAIYFGLLQSGYEYYRMDRCSSQTEELRKFVHMNKSGFFANAKQTSCQAYPYWPRAALLETASFYVDVPNQYFSDMKQLRQQILTAENILDEERNADFWAWLDDFPVALYQLMDDSAFLEYQQWESAWIKKQNSVHEEALNHIQCCVDKLCIKENAPFSELQIVVNPIKCKYAADYHLVKNRFIFCGGEFDAGSVIHESLHHAVHPVVSAYREEILQKEANYPELDSSYYLSGDDKGKLNAFEEFLVRQLTTAVLRDDIPDDLDDYVRMAIK